MVTFIMLEPKEPHLGHEPKLPKDYKEEHHSLLVEKTMTIQDIVSQLPKGITIDDVRVSIRERDSYCECWSEIYIYYIKRVPNTTFKSEMKAYEKAVEKFKERKALWEKEVEQYKLDVKEYLAWAKKEKFWVDENKYKELKKKYNIK
jgi:hypothetical protein